MIMMDVNIIVIHIMVAGMNIIVANPLLLFYFSESLRGWLDYPGPSVLFSSPLRGVSRVLGW